MSDVWGKFSSFQAEQRTSCSSVESEGWQGIVKVLFHHYVYF